MAWNFQIWNPSMLNLQINFTVRGQNWSLRKWQFLLQVRVIPAGYIIKCINMCRSACNVLPKIISSVWLKYHKQTCFTYIIIYLKYSADLLKLSSFWHLLGLKCKLKVMQISRVDTFYKSQLFWFWQDSTDFWSCVPCPTWMCGGTHVCIMFWNFLNTLTNKGKFFPLLVALF